MRTAGFDPILWLDPFAAAPLGPPPPRGGGGGGRQEGGAVSGAPPAVPPRAPAPRRWTMPRLQPPDPLVAPHHMEKHMASKLLRVGLVGAVLIAPLLSAGTAVLHAQAVPCDPALVSVAISPSAASIALGGTQQF